MSDISFLMMMTQKMFLEYLSVLHYKNLSQAEISLSPNINCFIGLNGVGKTNLLDAVYYLSFCKSNFMNVDTLSIQHREEFMMLQGRYRKGEKSYSVHCGLKTGEKKRFKLDDKPYTKLSEHIGFAPLVMITPSDDSLIGGGSDLRRRFLDSVISQTDALYLDALIRYNKALAQRNTLLKNERMIEDVLLEMWEEQMVLYGQIIHQTRKEFVEKLIPFFRHYHQFISSDTESVSLSYSSQLLESDFSQALSLSRGKDKIIGFTSVGIHKDDLEMMLGEHPIRKIGSQGQNKSFLIALKLAQFGFLKESCQWMPMLLLDDIFDKLDARRVEKIVQLVSSDDFGQIFITDTNRDHLDEILSVKAIDHKLFTVDNGAVFVFS